MFSVTRLLDVDESDRARIQSLMRAAAAASGAVATVVESTMPGSRNGGDLLVNLRFDNASRWHDGCLDDALADPAITRVNGATYEGTAVRRGTGSVYRVLLLRIQPSVDDTTVAAFEHELTMMPRYISSIVAWQLSRAETSIGTTDWTHVFEQEFTDEAGLLGPYLMHPIHWAVVDRWFDPETTDVIIRDRVCHSFCGLAEPVLR